MALHAAGGTCSASSHHLQRRLTNHSLSVNKVCIHRNVSKGCIHSKATIPSVTRASETTRQLATSSRGNFTLLSIASVLSVLTLALADPSIAEVAATTDSAVPFSAAGVFEAVQTYAAGSGSIGVAVFIAAYVVASVLLVPASVLTLAAGAIYGPLAGTAVVSAASTLGALSAFMVARTVARPWAEEKLQSSPKVKAVVAGVSTQGWRLVLLLRLSPLVPFGLLNYALGLTQISAVEYTLASWAGMLPGTFAYVYLGGAGRAALSAAGEGGVEPTQLLLWGLGAVGTLGATKLISDAAGKSLKEAEDQQPSE